MISVSIEFDSTRFDRVLTAFLELPLTLRPVSFGEDEDNISTRRPIEDVHRFVADNPDAGFFLFAPAYVCDFSFFGKKPSRADCDLKGGNDSARQILHALAATQPLFGYACAYEDYADLNSAHVIRFFDEPKDWRKYDFEAIRSACPAVFDIEKIRSQVSRTRTFQSCSR